MLKTVCTNCKCSVTSPLLTEASEIECPNCGTVFPVKDVCISAGPYTIYKEVLAKNAHKYIRLLREATKEAEDLKKQGENSEPHRKSAKTVEIFVQRLKELLEGCRDKLRVPGEETIVECCIEGAPCTCKLVNISTSGICIEMDDDSRKIALGKIIDLNIKDEKLTEPLDIKAEVVWSTDKGLTGLRFIGLEEHIRIPLCIFIAAKGAIDK